MAKLQDLESRYEAIRVNLGAYEEEKSKLVQDLRNTKATVKNLNKSINDLNNRINAFETVISTQTDPNTKQDLEEQKRTMQQELAEKTSERDRLRELGKAKKAIEENIEKANQYITSAEHCDHIIYHVIQQDNTNPEFMVKKGQ